jgi:putative PIN family toxin of toxin-antitoxin system
VLKAVLDTNVFVSSVLVKVGPPAQALAAWRRRRFVLVSSPAIVAEIRATLRYPRIRRRYDIADEDVDQLVTLLEHDALVVPGHAHVAGSIPQDPADECILACAIDAQADVIVSGDRHLLDLGTYCEIPILTVRQFLAQLSEQEAV